MRYIKCILISIIFIFSINILGYCNNYNINKNNEIEEKKKFDEALKKAIEELKKLTEQLIK